MKLVTGIASTTHVDAHNDKISKEALEDMSRQINNKYLPYLIDHDLNKQIGVVLSSKIGRFSDGEFALLAVFGVFETEDEFKQYPIKQQNKVWGDYLYLLDDIDVLEPNSQNITNNVIDNNIENIAILLEKYLDSTVVDNNGIVYKVKHLIASTGDLEFHLYPKDHNPPHFHIISKQRRINAKIKIETLELINTKDTVIDTRDIKKIINFFNTNEIIYKKLKEEFKRLQ